MAENYREQVIGLEDELARIREENDIGEQLCKNGKKGSFTGVMIKVECFLDDKTLEAHQSF